jgi:Domain of unknown function (DUF5076)
MGELKQPPATSEDEDATEMIRAWIAKGDLHVSLRLGMWQDLQNSDIDERDAWGELLADLTRHIANGMMKEHGWDYDSTRDRIRTAFLKWYDDKSANTKGDFLG